MPQHAQGTPDARKTGDMKADGKSKASESMAPATTSKDMKNPTAETKSPSDSKTAGEMKANSKTKSSDSAATSRDLKTPTAETGRSTPEDDRQCRNLGDSSASRRKAHPDNLGDQARESRGSRKRELQSLNRNGCPGGCPLLPDASTYRRNLSGMVWIRIHPCARQVHRSSPAHSRDRLHHRRLSDLAKRTTGSYEKLKGGLRAVLIV
jgi:hypothetical protein